MGIRAQQLPKILPSPPAEMNGNGFLGRRRRIILAALALALAAVAVVLVVRRTHQAEHEAIARMSPVERRALFEETRRSAELVCAEATAESALSDRCIETAHFLLAFPECDESCVAFVRLHEREATR